MLVSPTPLDNNITVDNMRYSEFKIVTKLLEASMAPGDLKRLASSIKAICGLEFEMIVPVERSDDDEEGENDYDTTYPRLYDINGIIEFFHLEDTGFEKERNEEFHEWQAEWEGEKWAAERDSAVREYIEENEWDLEAKYNEAYDTLGVSDAMREDFENFRSLSTYIPLYNMMRANTMLEMRQRYMTEFMPDYDKLPENARMHVDAQFTQLYHTVQDVINLVDEWLNDAAEESINVEDDNYEAAKEAFYEMLDYPNEGEWLSSIGISDMQDAERHWDLAWPIQRGSGAIAMDDIAREFETMIGRDTIGCKEYHGCESRKGHVYVIEPDTSLEPDDADEGFAGLEIVAPKLTLPEMIKDIHKVMQWANNKGCYTNESCGLHMNVSIEGVDIAKLDYVKLAIFSADNYITQQFGRYGRSYCESSIDKIKREIQYSPENAYNALTKLQGNLLSLATRLIHDNNTRKFVSLNVKSNRIEFRGPGNNWLDDDISKLENTLYRAVVSYDIACDPEKHKEEYATKLYKLINPEGNKAADAEQNRIYQLLGITDPEQLRQSMQELLKNELITKRNATKAADIEKGLPKPSHKSWIVTAPTGQQLEVKSNTAVGAIAVARANLKLNSTRYPNEGFKVMPNIQSDLFGHSHPIQSKPIADSDPYYNPDYGYSTHRDLFKEPGTERWADAHIINDPNRKTK